MANNNDGITVPTDTNYDNWGWKEIELAIVGAVDTSANASAAATPGVSNPDSFAQAAAGFAAAGQMLDNVYNQLNTWTNKIVGQDGQWTGAGAGSFKTMMNSFLTAVDTLRKPLAGDGGVAGGLNSPYGANLLDAGSALANGINQINQIDAQAAQDTLNKWQAGGGKGPQPWRVQDGTTIVAVSTYPDIVNDMTNKMRTVMKYLAGQYTSSMDAMKDPGPVKFPNSNGSNGANGPGNQVAGVDDPNGTGVNDPNAPGGVNDPNAPGGVNDPNAPGGVNDPNAPGGVNDPNAPGGVNDPNAPGGVNDPNAPGGVNDPNAPGGVNDPNAPGGVNDPNVQGGPNSPNGIGAPNVPSLNGPGVVNGPGGLNDPNNPNGNPVDVPNIGGAPNVAGPGGIGAPGGSDLTAPPPIDSPAGVGAPKPPPVGSPANVNVPSISAPAGVNAPTTPALDAPAAVAGPNVPTISGPDSKNPALPPIGTVPGASLSHPSGTVPIPPISVPPGVNDPLSHIASAGAPTVSPFGPGLVSPNGAPLPSLQAPSPSSLGPLPSVNTPPPVSVPNLAPGLSTPGLSTPGVSTPDLSTPNLSTPSLSTPGIGGAGIGGLPGDAGSSSGGIPSLANLRSGAGPAGVGNEPTALTGATAGEAGAGAGGGAAAGAGGAAGAPEAGMPSGMPAMPMGGMGMGGMGNRGKDEQGDRTTWLQEDEDIWGADPNVGPSFLDGNAAPHDQ